MPLGATETGLGAVTARGWGMGSHQQLAGLGGPMAGAGWARDAPILCGNRAVRACCRRLDYRPVAGFGGLAATWVAGGLLSGLLGLFPGLGGLLRAGRGWWRALGRPQ